jgi:AcrR family transcriptional regulator
MGKSPLFSEFFVLFMTFHILSRAAAQPLIGLSGESGVFKQQSASAADSMGLREQKKAAIRQDILRAGRQVFAEKGFEAASVSDIIRKTDLSRATFYLHFQNKEQIFAELTNKLFRRMFVDLGRARQTGEKAGQDFRDVLTELSYSVFATFEKQEELIRIFMRSGGHVDPKFDAQLQKYLDMVIHAIQDLVQQYNDKGVIETPDSKLMAWVIYGSLRELWHQLRERANAPEVDVRSKLRQLVILIMNGALKAR